MRGYMGKKKLQKSKKNCLSIYRFMENWLDVTNPIWNKLHHGEMKTYLLVKGYKIPPNASMSVAEKQDHIENDYLYVRDTAGMIACYHNPKKFHPDQLLKELQTVSAEELLTRRRRMLQEEQYDYDPETGQVERIATIQQKQKVKKYTQGGR